MTAVVVAQSAPPPPVGPNPIAQRPPRQRTEQPVARPAIALTVQVTLCDDVPDPTEALRKLVERIGAVSDLSVVAPTQVDTHSPKGDAAVGPGVGPDTVRLDVHARTVSRGGEEITLCRREFDLLEFLVRHAGQVFTRRQLLHAVWEDVFVGPRTVDVHIRRLRHKLAGRRPLITTVRGVGYRLATGAGLVTVGPSPARELYPVDQPMRIAPAAAPSPLLAVQRGAA